MTLTLLHKHEKIAKFICKKLERRALRMSFLVTLFCLYNLQDLATDSWICAHSDEEAYLKAEEQLGLSREDFILKQGTVWQYLI